MMDMPVSGDLRVEIKAGINSRCFLEVTLQDQFHVSPRASWSDRPGEEKAEVGFHLDYTERRMAAAVNAAVSAAIDDLRKQYGIEPKNIL